MAHALWWMEPDYKVIFVLTVALMGMGHMPYRRTVYMKEERNAAMLVAPYAVVADDDVPCRLANNEVVKELMTPWEDAGCIL